MIPPTIPEWTLPTDTTGLRIRIIGRRATGKTSMVKKLIADHNLKGVLFYHSNVYKEEDCPNMLLVKEDSPPSFTSKGLAEYLSPGSYIITDDSTPAARNGWQRVSQPSNVNTIEVQQYYKSKKDTDFLVITGIGVDEIDQICRDYVLSSQSYYKVHNEEIDIACEKEFTTPKSWKLKEGTFRPYIVLDCKKRQFMYYRN